MAGASGTTEVGADRGEKDGEDEVDSEQVARGTIRANAGKRSSKRG